MKSIVVAAVGLILVATPALAQRKFIGMTGGATLSDFGSINSGSRWGGTAGITVGYRGFNWSVTNLEVAWTQRGDEYIRLDYIDVPLLMGGSVQMGGGARMRGYAGIDVAFKIGCNSSSVLYNCDNTNGTQWFVPFGVMIGKWKQGSTYFGIDVRYVVGLSHAFSTSSIYSRGWQFKVNIGKSVGR